MHVHFKLILINLEILILLFMKRILYFIAIALIFSSSNESLDESLIKNNPLNITGKIIAPNGIDPISEGKISVISNNAIVQEIFSDTSGNFSFFLDYGNYDLVISKGLFKTESSILLSDNTDSFNYDLGDVSFDQFPNIGVVTGYYDNIERKRDNSKTLALEYLSKVISPTLSSFENLINAENAILPYLDYLEYLLASTVFVKK